MKTPPHSGRIVRQECLEPLGITITQAARALGVERETLNNLSTSTPAFPPKWPSGYPKPLAAPPEMWLGLQMQYNLARAERSTSAMKVKKISHNQPQKTA